MVLALALLSLLFYITVQQVTSFKLRCPATSEWSLTGKAMCNITDKYFCLYNNVENQYVQGCDGPDYDRKGKKRIFAGYFTRASCEENRYQPFKFWTNGSSDCVYQKTLCNEEGQIHYSNGSTKEDRFCSCDFTSGYAFVVPPSNMCYCNLSALEDCSCYLKTCTEGYTLSADYECVKNISKPTKCPGHRIKISKDEPDKPILPNPPNELTMEKVLGIDRQNKNAFYCTLGALILMIIVCFAVWNKRNIALFCKQPIDKDKSKQKYETIYSRQKSSSSSSESSDDSSPEQPVTLSRSYNQNVSSHIHDQGDDEIDVNKYALDPVKVTEVYYLRIIHLLFTLACPVLRMTFDKEVHPEKLSSLLNIHREQLNKQKLYQYEKDILFPKEKKDKVTSAAFDIKILITLLNTLAKKKVGNVWPDRHNTSEKANLERVYYGRNLTTQILNGQLSFEDFTLYWDNISQAILRLASPVLHSIEENSKDSESLLMMERIVNLNPVDFQHKTLHKFVQLADVYSSKMFSQIINEFCTSKKISVEKLLDRGKHKLFHKRKKTKSCCQCEPSQWTFHRCLAEKEWNTIYSKSDRNNSHSSKCKGDVSKCCECFYLKPGFNLESCDRSLCMCIILYIPALLKFTITKICSSGGFHDFLGKHRNRLYHAMSSKCGCCVGEPNCEIILDDEDWGRLYEKFEETSSVCTSSDCHCMYRVQEGITTGIMDGILLSKIVNTVGPISAIKHNEDAVFKRFINGNLDEKYLRESCNNINTVLNELLDTMSDDEFRKDMKKTIFSINQSVEESKIKDDLQEWASTHLADRQPLESPGIQRAILIRQKDGFKLFEVQSTEPFNFSDRREPKNVTKPENYYLRVFHLLLTVAYPVVKVIFDSEFPPKDLTDILHEWSSGHGDEPTSDTKDNKNGMRHHRLYLTKKQRKAVFDTEGSSENFDIQLMGYLLKKWMEKKDKGDKSISADLQILLAIDDKIMHNCNGRLTQTEFDKYWKEIKEASIRLGGGEKSRKCCFELEKIDNILV